MKRRIEERSEYVSAGFAPRASLIPGVWDQLQLVNQAATKAKTSSVVMPGVPLMSARASLAKNALR